MQFVLATKYSIIWENHNLFYQFSTIGQVGHFQFSITIINNAAKNILVLNLCPNYNNIFSYIARNGIVSSKIGTFYEFGMHFSKLLAREACQL